MRTLVCSRSTGHCTEYKSHHQAISENIKQTPHSQEGNSMYLPGCRKGADNHVSLLYGLDTFTSLNHLTSNLVAHNDALIRRLNASERMEITAIALVSGLDKPIRIEPRPKHLYQKARRDWKYILLTSHTALYTSLSQQYPPLLGFWELAGPRRLPCKGRGIPRRASCQRPY